MVASTGRLSHSGMEQGKDGRFTDGEDVCLTEAVPGIDVVIGAQSHTELHEAVIECGPRAVVASVKHQDRTVTPERSFPLRDQRGQTREPAPGLVVVKTAERCADCLGEEDGFEDLLQTVAAALPK